ncbi:IS66 family insertion sequence element accessory protein TnpB [Leuconostoc mesenteroides]|uniref:IS66 family insertion sequence element accessory protein TnpB n=1 Tax=Leuconostoc mesenteroides TaxID=1245 RepID=UPI0035CAB34D
MRKIKGIYLVCGKTDLRRGIDGLANIILDQFKLDPYSKSLCSYTKKMDYFYSVRKMKV